MSINLENRHLFDKAAQAYDRFRPTYPTEAIDCVLSFSHLHTSSRLLEVGAGTGKATVLVAAHGYAIDCLEPGDQLSELTRSRCSAWPRVNVITERFEDFDSPPNHYDLIYAAQSFHWIEPTVRFRKARDILSRNGSIAILYNYTPAPEGGLAADLHRAIETASNGEMKSGNYEHEVARWSTEIKADNLFFNLKVERFRWRSEYTSEDYAGLVGTYSTFLSLDKKTQKRIISAVKQVFSTYKENLIRDIICVVFLARKNRRKSI